MLEEVLRATNISKAFMGNKVLHDISLCLYAGECLALVGENGAGKSTLMKILSGIYSMDGGEICINGQPVVISSPKDAQKYGISIIHQELNLIPNLSVAQNIFLGRELQKDGISDDRRMYREAKALFDEMKVSIDPNAPIVSYTVAEQQIVEISRVLSQNADIIIMDEPTAALSVEETTRLFEIIDKLKKAGKSIIYISHRLEEIFRIAERICVLRDGRLVKTLTPQAQVQEVVEAMAGQSIQDFYPKEHFDPGSVVLKAENLSDGKKFFDINFEVHEGEVYGIAGLLGAGQTQLARSIYGLNRLQTGSIVLNGDPYHHPTPKRSISMGLGMITEDRKTEGLVQRMSIRENATLSPFAPIHGAMGVIRTAKERMLATESVRNYSIKCESIQQEVLLLSGGNQQKVVLARALAPMPKVVIMCEPTRGVDVNGKVEIYRIINELLRQRKAVILVSSEIPEVLGMSDRVAVMYKGRFVFEKARSGLTQEEIMYYATGGHERG